MDIFAGIDGTGTYSNNQYAQDFSNSFVRRIFKTWHTPHAYYLRGPGADGLSTGFRADAMLSQVEDAWNRMKGTNEVWSRAPRIFLAGYSRGGAAAANMAHELKDKKIPVHCLLLFDAVDRSLSIWKNDVPENVHLCFHALRHPNSGSRESFGNCATDGAHGHKIHKDHFMCTHGAMGGTPWTEAESDGFIHERDLTSPIGHSPKAGPKDENSILTKIAATAADLYGAPSKTNITLSQEKIGGAAVWSWMSKNLATAKAANEFPNIGDFGLGSRSPNWQSWWA